MARWTIDVTHIEEWLDQLSGDEYDNVLAALEFLEELGPGCGRPFVDQVHQSRHPNMKELRPRGGNIRILFAFDPKRVGITLLAGDKTGSWNKWYRKNVPIADDRYDAHLRKL